MIEFFKTKVNATHNISAPEPGCWVNVIDPTDEERDWLIEELGIVPEFVRSALDDEERSHTDFDDDTYQTLIIIDCPFIESLDEAEDASITQYDTHPLSFLFLPRQDMIVTISLLENETIENFTAGRIRGINTNQRTRLLLQIMAHIALRYLSCLRNLERQFVANEKRLRETLNNTELMRMLGFEKSLIYFSTSLKNIEATLTKISSGRVVKLYEDDDDLLDDVLIEIRQAIEMCTIERQILSSSMDTFGSIISNGLNSTMRLLTIITLVLAIPTIVFSFYGMNVSELPLPDTWLFPACLSLVMCILAALFLFKGRMFK